MKRLLIGFTIAALSIFVGFAFGQKPEPPKPPAISDALKVKFFKAQAEMLAANEAAQKATQDAQLKQAALQGAIDELNKACGDAFAITLDSSREPACVAKTPPAEPPAASK